MKKLMATVTAVILCLCMSLGLTACGGKSGSTIVVWCEATGADKAAMDAFVQYFNENNDLGYSMTYKMQDGVTSSLASAALGGAAPDLVLWPRWETVTKSNLVHDLTAKIEASSAIDLSGYNDAAQRELTVNGKVYGVSTDLDAWGLWCNMDLMTEAQIPTTWEELKASTTALTSGTGNDMIVGLDAYNLRGQFYSFMLTLSEGKLIDTSGAVPTVNINTSDKTSKSYKDAESVMNLFIELMQITGCPTDYHTDDKFIEGKVAMKFGPSNYDKTVETLLGRKMNLKFVGYPAKSATEGQVAGMLGGYSLAIPKSKDLDKSFKVMEWWLSDANLQKYCELYNLLPAKESLQNAAFVSESQVLTAMKEMLPACNVRPIAKGYSNVEVTWIFSTIDSLREYIRTNNGTIKDAESALKQIKEKGDAQFQLEMLL